MSMVLAGALLVFALAAPIAPWRRWKPGVALVMEGVVLGVVLVGGSLLADRVSVLDAEGWGTGVLYAAAYWYALAGGMGLVRIVLALVPVAEEAEAGGIHVPSAELARGRIIGVLERAIALTLVLAGEFGALGLIVAAKALARFHELKHRDFAEYFLIGTLASLLHALLVGFAIRLLL